MAHPIDRIEFIESRLNTELLDKIEKMEVVLKIEPNARAHAAEKRDAKDANDPYEHTLNKLL